MEEVRPVTDDTCCKNYFSVRRQIKVMGTDFSSNQGNSVLLGFAFSVFYLRAPNEILFDIRTQMLIFIKPID